MGLTIGSFAKILDVSYPTARKYVHNPESIKGGHLIKFLNSEVCKENNFTSIDYINCL